MLDPPRSPLPLRDPARVHRGEPRGRHQAPRQFAQESRYGRGEHFAPPEIQALLAAADARWRVVILTAVLTGLREGELLGVAWGDIDWSARQIYVRQQYTAGRFSELKTKASRRRVDLPGELVAELRRWRLACPPGAHDSRFPDRCGQSRESRQPVAPWLLSSAAPRRTPRPRASLTEAHRGVLA